MTKKYLVGVVLHFKYNFYGRQKLQDTRYVNEKFTLAYIYRFKSNIYLSMFLNINYLFHIDELNSFIIFSRLRITNYKTISY